MVKFIFGWEIEGIMNGNIDIVVVKIILICIKDDVKNVVFEWFVLEVMMVNNVLIIVIVGII